MLVRAVSNPVIAACCCCCMVALVTIDLWAPTWTRPKRKKLQPKVSASKLWWARTLGKNSFILRQVRVPIACMPERNPSSLKSIVVDHEGFVECSIHIQDGIIVEISTALEDLSKSFQFCKASVDCHGAILIPCFVDCHTHLIKTQTVPRMRNISGTMGEAYLKAEVADKVHWPNAGDIFRRMDFAAKCALHHGTRAIRTHLDGCDAEDLRQEVYAAFDAIREKYSPDLIVQGVANLFLPLWLTPLAEDHANEARRHKNVVLGAYVGNPPPGSDDETIQAMDALFGHAHRLSMDCDLHIDESNDPQCCALRLLCVSLSKARAAGFQGRVVLGHCCSLSLQEKETQNLICERLSVLEAFVVCNPFTNLGLQDRKGSEPPFSAIIAADEPRTPQWRGLTLLQELRHWGVVVACASDNVRDYWYPYGDFDLLSVWAQAQAMGHLDTDPTEGSWADICTIAPARAMGLNSSLEVGQPADVVLFPSARRASELFARPQVDRLVLRQGMVRATKLPEFSELDDLIEVQ